MMLSFKKVTECIYMFREDAILEEEEESADMLSIMSSDDVDTGKYLNL